MATVIFLFILFLSAGKVCAAFAPKDHYLLSCGFSTSSSVNAFDGRVWFSDENSTFSSSFSSSCIADSANHDPSNPGAPFTAARIFNSSFTYTFPVSRPGPIFLRLFFYPALYSNLDASRFFLSVQANDHHLLLHNFSAQLAVEYVPLTRSTPSTADKYIMKEYHLTIPNNSLQLTFTPTPPSSYAFINGIEVVSVPQGLYVPDKVVKNVESPSVSFPIARSDALETAYRLNVGGSDQTDGDMYRLWKADDPYTFLFAGQPGSTANSINYTKTVPNYTAPEQVYKTYKQLAKGPAINTNLNLTWRFKVDPGFYYMLRLHWCEDDYHINDESDLLFDVYINNFTAESPMDVMAWTDNHRYVPVFRDYVVFVTGGEGSGGSGDIWLTLLPSTIKHNYYEVLLNGLEIFKMSRPDGGLDAPNPNVPLASKNHGKQNPIQPPNRSHLLPAIIGGILSGIVLTSLACLLIFRGKPTKRSDVLERSGSHSKITKKWLLNSYRFGRKASSTSSSPQPNRCYRFPLSQINSATDNFSDTFIIGTGGFGIVYVGTIQGVCGTKKVAIKRLKQSSKQGINEFRTEIEMLSSLRHEQLVSLIGYCDDQEEMILVYDYMEGGTLRGHLYNTHNPPLSWNQRLTICIGVARALHYLHAGGNNMIIHRDVKSSNILLDEELVAKLSDFGLSKVGPTSEEFNHISTMVKGSLGYVDPEYYRRRQLTEKSDVYSFGVVLFEVLCGRPAVNPNLPKEEMNIVMWARRHQQRGNLDVIVDPKLSGQIELECLRKFGEIAERCVRNNGTERPSMFDVVQALEICLLN